MGQFVKKSAGRNVGDIFAHAGTTPPRGALACDAGRYSVTDYPKLFAAIAHRYAAIGDDTGDGLFRVPGSENVQPFFRQAEKVSIPGLAFDPAPDLRSYTNMTGSEFSQYGYDYAEVPEDGRDNFHVYRNGASSGAWSRYRWPDVTVSAGRIYLPVVWQAKFNSNCNTYHHFGLLNPTDPDSTAIEYGIRIQAQQSGGTRVLSNVSALSPGGTVTNITATVFPSGTPSFAGDTIELSLCLWFDLDGLEWGLQVGQVEVSMGAMSALPVAGLAPSYLVNWTGSGNAEGFLYMLYSSALDCAGFGSLSPSAWDVAPIVAPSGFSNLWDWPDSVSWATGATGGDEFHDHGGATAGHALTNLEVPPLTSPNADFDGGATNVLYQVGYDAATGAEHSHGITSVSALPPYIDVLYCIQYK